MSEQQVLDREETTTANEPLSTADIAAGRLEKAPENPSPWGTERSEPLFAHEEAEGFRARWQNVQTGFVDEPRKAVKDADELVAAAMKRLAEIFANERDKLEHDWDRNDNVSTEDLRIALRRYRSFFDRLLAV
jgi:hypothetical protein